MDVMSILRQIKELAVKEVTNTWDKLDIFSVENSSLQAVHLNLLRMQVNPLLILQ